MKKNLIIAAGAVLVAAAASAFVYVNNEENGLTSLLKANVEALMMDEGITDTPCYPVNDKCTIQIRDVEGNVYNLTIEGLANGIFVR